MSNNTTSIGEFRLDAVNRTLTKDNQSPITLNWKTFSVLTLLANHQNEIVTRETIIKEIWDDNFLVGDKALSTAIWNLRKSFENSSVKIATVPKKGYRLSILEPEQVETDVDAIIIERSSGRENEDSNEKNNQKNSASKIGYSKSAFVVILVLLFTTWFITRSGSERPNVIDSESASNSKVVAFLTRGDIDSPEINQFIDNLEQAIAARNGVDLIDEEDEKLIIRSQSHQTAASTLGIDTIIYLQVSSLNADDINITLKLSEVNTNAFETANWQTDIQALNEVEAKILSKLPSGDWR